MKHKRGCLALLILSAGFITLIYGAIYFAVTTQNKKQAEMNNLKQLSHCQQLVKKNEEGNIQNFYDTEACLEMKKQHDFLFGYQN